MTRRDLIQKIVIGGTTFFILPPILTQCSKPADDNPDPNPGGGSNPITIDLSSTTYTSLNTAGASVVVQGIIIANIGNNTFIALDSTCTHMGCTIGYNLASNTFPCPCHGSVYSTTGAVINGPAPGAVKSHTVTKSGTILTIAP